MRECVLFILTCLLTLAMAVWTIDYIEMRIQVRRNTELASQCLQQQRPLVEAYGKFPTIVVTKDQVLVVEDKEAEAD
jgi:hypothetical protein